MKRSFVLVLTTAVLTALFLPAGAAPSSPAPPQPGATAKLTKWQLRQQSLFKSSAPADEYFGRQKMSFLGINNGLRYQAAVIYNHTVDPGVIAATSRIEDALHAWATKYPTDPQLARSYFLATRTYTKIWTQSFQDKAWQYLHAIVNRYPSSFFAKQVRRDLAVGFTEHYYASPEPCPTMSPVPTPTESPSPEPPHGRKHPAPSPSPTETPTPEPTASPTAPPTPTPGPGRPKVEILIPPCSQELTPPPVAPTPIQSVLPTTLPSAALPTSPAPNQTSSPIR